MDDWGVGVAGSRAVDTNGSDQGARIKRAESHPGEIAAWRDEHGPEQGVSRFRFPSIL